MFRQRNPLLEEFLLGKEEARKAAQKRLAGHCGPRGLMASPLQGCQPMFSLRLRLQIVELGG